jgi:hypothetical protein
MKGCPVRRIVVLLIGFVVVMSVGTESGFGAPWDHGRLKVSANGHFLVHEDGTPFLWLGDTVWDLVWLKRDEVEYYLEKRRQQGFNAILLTAWNDFGPITRPNVYGDVPFVDGKLAQPLTTAGADPDDAEQYDYWDHLDYIIDSAKAKGLYITLLPAYGDYVMKDPEFLTAAGAKTYGEWIAARYQDRPNIIWINGGDLHADAAPHTLPIWLALGRALKATTPDMLVTHHPRGQKTSSTALHHEPWLDFNMFQSGHATTPESEENYRFVEHDWSLVPPKPTLDGEPAYEDIAIGLNPKAEFGYFRDNTVRRKAYWSLLAGACGYVYGQNAVWQFAGCSNNPHGSYAKAELKWRDAMERPGTLQMGHVKRLMLSRPFITGTPDQTILDGDPGRGFEHLRAIRGDGYLFVYSHTGRAFGVHLGKISGTNARAWWYNPRDGKAQEIGVFANTGVRPFTPPGAPAADGSNDWVLVVDDAAKEYSAPGTVTE